MQLSGGTTCRFAAVLDDGVPLVALQVNLATAEGARGLQASALGVGRGQIVPSLQACHCSDSRPHSIPLRFTHRAPPTLSASSFPTLGVTADVAESAAFLRLLIFFKSRNISLHFLCSGSCFRQLVMWLLAYSYSPKE